ILEAESSGCRKRAAWQARARHAGVVVARRHVVRAVGIEERREHLDVTPADTELELPPTVQLDSTRLAVLDALEHARDSAEPRRRASTRRSGPGCIGDRAQRRGRARSA